MPAYEGYLLKVGFVSYISHRKGRALRPSVFLGALLAHHSALGGGSASPPAQGRNLRALVRHKAMQGG